MNEPANILNPGEIDKSTNHDDLLSVRKWLPFITYEGAFANVFIIFTGGAFLTGLALMLGANDFQIGLLAAIPFLSQIAQLISAYLVDRTGKRKSITMWSIVFSRQLWWLLLPVLFLPGEWRLAAVITVVVFSSITTMIATPTWLSWMADLVPDRIRGRYFGNRSAVIAISTISTVLLGGVVLDKFRALNHEYLGYVITIGAGSLCALIAAVLLGKLPDKSPEEIRVERTWSHVLQPLKDKSFRHLLRVFLVWNFAVGISAAFFAPHMLNNLKMTWTLIATYASIASLVAVVLNKPWGILIDRFGSKPVLATCAFGIAIVPLIWWIPRADFLWILWFESIFTGGLWTGFNLAAFNIPIANSPKEGRAIYLAMFSVVTGLAFFAASLMGGALAQTWHHIHWHLGKQTIVNYHLLFGVSCVLRLLAAFMALSFHEPKEKEIPLMIQTMGYAVLRRLSVGRQLFPWIFR